VNIRLILTSRRTRPEPMVAGSLADDPARLVIASRDTEHQDISASLDWHCAHCKSENPRLESGACDIFKPQDFCLSIDLQGRKAGRNAILFSHADDDLSAGSVCER